MSRGTRAATGILAVLALASTACTSPSRKGTRITVEATVAPILDIVRQVVGDRVELIGLIPEGVDSHTFEPSPETVKALSRADVLFMAGLHLEGSTLKQARANMPKPVRMGTNVRQDRNGSNVVALGDLTVDPSEWAYDFTFPRAEGDPNPHIWMDPTWVIRWSTTILDTMRKLDPQNEDVYTANQREFVRAVDRLDVAIAKSIKSIPSEHRRLLTYHDSFAYFSRRYGIPVLGAVQPSDFSEPSPRDIRNLIEQVRSNNVPAIFGSEVFPSTVLAQVAREAHARYVDKLRDDELPGAPGDPNHTYLGMMAEDAIVITEALGGNASPIKAVPVRSTWDLPGTP